MGSELASCSLTNRRKFQQCSGLVGLAEQSWFKVARPPKCRIHHHVFCCDQQFSLLAFDGNTPQFWLFALVSESQSLPQQVRRPTNTSMPGTATYLVVLRRGIYVSREGSANRENVSVHTEHYARTQKVSSDIMKLHNFYFTYWYVNILL